LRAGARADRLGDAYDADIDRARRLMPLVEEGFAASLTEAATRFALSHPAMGTILVGMATPQQFEDALARWKKARCRKPRSTGCLSCGKVCARESPR
jgi:predicted aldo/keto reductase-like oxidoreductase